MNTWYKYLVIAALVISCKETPQDKPVVNWTPDQSTELNKNLAEEEEIETKLFLAQHSYWKVKKTGSGLQYYLFLDASGESIQAGDRVDISYKVKLYDGKLCYETPDDEVEEVIVNNADVESGLHEGLKLMSEGDRAHFLIPSHLAHGLLGDQKNIPPLTPIWIEVKVERVIKK